MNLTRNRYKLLHLEILSLNFWRLWYVNNHKNKCSFYFHYLMWLLNYIYIGCLAKREVKMAGYWPSSSFAYLWTETKSRSINSQIKSEAISRHLNRTSLVNKGFVIWDKTPKHDKFPLQDKARIPSGQDSSILPAPVANHSTRFGSSCPLTELVIW